MEPIPLDMAVEVDPADAARLNREMRRHGYAFTVDDWPTTVVGPTREDDGPVPQLTIEPVEPGMGRLTMTRDGIAVPMMVSERCLAVLIGELGRLQATIRPATETSPIAACSSGA